MPKKLPLQHAYGVEEIDLASELLIQGALALTQWSMDGTGEKKYSGHRVQRELVRIAHSLVRWKLLAAVLGRADADPDGALRNLAATAIETVRHHNSGRFPTRDSLEGDLGDAQNLAMHVVGEYARRLSNEKKKA